MKNKLIDIDQIEDRMKKFNYYIDSIECDDKNIKINFSTKNKFLGSIICKKNKIVKIYKNQFENDKMLNHFMNEMLNYDRI